MIKINLSDLFPEDDSSSKIEGSKDIDILVNIAYNGAKEYVSELSSSCNLQTSYREYTPIELDED